jgi:hypothetical protein
MMDYPNQGTMWHNTEKKHPKAPDFSGSMLFEKDYLQHLIEQSSNGEVEIKLDLWKSKVNTRNGERHVLNTKVNTYVKPDAQPADNGKDPWDE